MEKQRETLRGIVDRIIKTKDGNEGRTVTFIGSYIKGNKITKGIFTTSSINIATGFCFEGTSVWSPYEGKSYFHMGKSKYKLSYPESQNEIFLMLCAGFPDVSPSDIKSFMSIENIDSFDKALDSPDLIRRLVPEGSEIWDKIYDCYHNMRLLLTSGMEKKDIGLLYNTYNIAFINYKMHLSPFELLKCGVRFSVVDNLSHLIKFPDYERLRNSYLIQSISKALAKNASTVEFSDDISAVINKEFGKLTRDTAKKIIEGIKISSRMQVANFSNDDESVGIIMNNDAENIENDIASQIIHRMNNPAKPIAEVGEKIKKICADPRYERFDSIQRLAVGMTASEPVCIVTGGPGTGKSTVTSSIADICSMFDEHIYLVSPTGKAAKRLQETTKRKTSTIHSLLGATGQKDMPFRVNEHNKLAENSVVIVDEASIMDLELMYALLKAMPETSRLILVGDSNQLPSIGPGTILSDMLSSVVLKKLFKIKAVPAIELQKVYRQAEDSGIATGAAKIKKGLMPDMSYTEKAGVQFKSANRYNILDKIKETYDEHLNRGVERDDIIIACPQNPGPGGTFEINEMMSKHVNSRGQIIPGIQRMLYEKMPIPRVGDKVMLTENDNKRGVMNGDMGYIISCNPKGQKTTFTVRYDAKDEQGKNIEIDYPVSQWRKIVLAYACTVHKLQGSQAKTVIMSILPEHRNLFRNLIYTGWTRAEKNVVVTGDKNAFKTGIETVRDFDRKTMLRMIIEHTGYDIAFKNRKERPHWHELLKKRCKEMGLPIDNIETKNWYQQKIASREITDGKHVDFAGHKFNAPTIRISNDNNAETKKPVQTNKRNEDALVSANKKSILTNTGPEKKPQETKGFTFQF